MSRRYEIEWPQTDDPRWLIREWWTFENEDEWVKLPYSKILSSEQELKEWIKDNWGIEL